METGTLFIYVVEKFGLPVILGFLLGYTIKQLLFLQKSFDAAVDGVNQMVAGHVRIIKHLEERAKHETHPKDPNRILHRSEVLDAVMDTLQRVEGVEETIKAHCGSANCPLVPVFDNRLKLLSLEFEKQRGEWLSFANQADKDRKETLVSIQQIFDKISSVIQSTMDKLVSTLEKAVERLKQNGSGQR